MRVILAEQSGFCFGVKRAIEIVESVLKKTKEVCLLGPIIHNPQEVARLEGLGATTVKDIKDCKRGFHVVISTHGVSPSVIQNLEHKKFKNIDTTCPIVKKAQSSARLLNDEGYTVLIVGKASHPEVLGILGHIKTKGFVAQDVRHIPNFKKDDRVGIIAQTTMSEEVFRDVISHLIFQVSEVKVINTICCATRLRQNSAVDLARKVEVMIVIGGFNSANTCRLYELCKRHREDTYHIECKNQLNTAWFKGKKTIGITAGASTPDWIIDEVMTDIKRY